SSPAPPTRRSRLGLLIPAGGTMPGLRRWLVGFVLALSSSAHAAPQLTAVQDILYNPDGTRFNGLLTISSPGFDAADGSKIASRVLQVSVANGYLQVQLVPTTTAPVPPLYAVTYSSDSSIQFSETWSIPPSATPLRVKDVRVSSAAG